MRTYFTKKEAIENIIETLENGYSGYYCDLHNEVFNTDYYIIGTAYAKEALNEYGVFDAIDVVQSYENHIFGELYTDISDSEKLASMLWYIIGEGVISENDELPNYWNNLADDETNKIIVESLKEDLKECE